MNLLRTARTLMATTPWLLPASPRKNALLNRLGHDVDPTAHVGTVVMLNVGKVEIGANATIGSASVYKGLQRLSVGKDAVLGGFNLISAATELAPHLSTKQELVLGESACITTRHTIDCSAPVELKPFSILAGHGSQVLTHSIDVRRNAQSAYPVVIGERTFVGTRVVLLGGAKVPGHSVVAAGSVVTPGETADGSLMAGVPAKAKTTIDGRWFTRAQEKTGDVYDPTTHQLTPEAF